MNRRREEVSIFVSAWILSVISFKKRKAALGVFLYSQVKNLFWAQDTLLCYKVVILFWYYEYIWLDDQNYTDPVLLCLSSFGTPWNFTIVHLNIHRNHKNIFSLKLHMNLKWESSEWKWKVTFGDKISQHSKVGYIKKVESVLGHWILAERFSLPRKKT